MRKKSRVRLWRGLSTTFAVLSVIGITATEIAMRFSTEINYSMNISDSVLVDSKDGTDTEYYKSDYDSLDQLMEDKYELIREIQSEGSVLLKNNGALPLSSDENKVTLLGVSSVNPAFSGNNGGSSFGNGNIEQAIDMKTCFENAGLDVNPKMWEYYQNCEHQNNYSGDWNSSEAQMIMIDEAPVSEFPKDNGYAQYGDAAIVTITRQGREGSDLPYENGVADGSGNATGKHSLQIQDSEMALIEHAKEKFEKVIVLINSDNVMELGDLEKDEGVDAILWVGSVGVNGLEGVGDILLGNVNPSGRTVDTYASDLLSAPAMQNFGTTAYANADNYEIAVDSDGGYVVYQEGIYVGYRYYETRYEDCVLGGRNADSKSGTYASSGGWNYDEEMVYPFGYGLSYTTFTQTLDSLEVKDGIARATVTVKNTGNVPGKDVVELYVQAPYTEGGIERSAIQLAAFAKTDELGTSSSDNSQTLTLEFDLRYVAGYDYENAQTYVLEAGDYYFTIGNDAHDALNNVLALKAPDQLKEEGNSSNVKIYTVAETDKDTYSTSVTGYKVTNQLAHADVNTYQENACTYLTRSDWNTFPSGVENLEATVEMQENMAGDFYEPGSSDTSDIVEGSDETELTIASMMGKEYDDPDWETLLNQLSVKEMSKFIASARTDVRRLTSISFNGTYGRDGSIGMQAQYGIKDVGKDYEAVKALGTDPVSGVAYTEMYALMLPSLCVQASTWSQEMTEKIGRMYGNDSIWTGYSWQRAPGCNIHRTPFSGRNFEYYSEDPMIAFYLSAYLCKSANEYGVIMTPKHFAFNDQEVNRIGISTYFNEQAAREIYLRAFEGAFVEGKATSVMSAYNRVGGIFSGADYALQTEILRNEWGFKGIDISDYLRSTNMVYAKGAEMIMAGTNCICNPSDSDYAGKDQDLNHLNISSDAKLLKAVRERVHEMLYTFVNSNAMNGHSDGTKVVEITPWWQKTLIAVDSVFVLLTLGTAVLMLKGGKTKKKEQNGVK